MRSRGLGLVAALALLVGCTATSGHPAAPGTPLTSSASTASPTRSSSAATVPSSLAQRTCPTSNAAGTSAYPKLPNSVARPAAVPADAALTSYVAANGLLAALAPTGWRCAAAIGADGSETVWAWPGGPRPTAPGRATQLVLASLVPACTGCIYSDVCRVISLPTLAAAYPGECTGPGVAAKERVVTYRSGVYGFADPAGVHGFAPFSGGLPTEASLLFRLKPLTDWQLSCTVAPAKAGDCDAVNAAFRAAYSPVPLSAPQPVNLGPGQSPQRVLTVTELGTPYTTLRISVWAENTVTDCAAHAYGYLVTYLHAHPCVRATRRLLSFDLGGRTVAMSTIAVLAKAEDPAHLYDNALQLIKLEQEDGTGGLNDLLREGYRMPGATRIPANETFYVGGQDLVVAIFDAWYVSGANRAQDPALLTPRRRPGRHCHLHPDRVGGSMSRPGCHRCPVPTRQTRTNATSVRALISFGEEG